MELDNNKLLDLYPEFDRVYGPYTRKDDRKVIILSNTSLPKTNKMRLKTLSYPKALVEAHHGRRLLQNETIDHIDRNKQNDSPANLVIRDRVEHCSIDALRVDVEAVECPSCNKEFIPSVNQRNSKGIVAGPFCSNKCKGVYGAGVQNGAPILLRNKINKTYYRKKKDNSECGEIG